MPERKVDAFSTFPPGAAARRGGKKRPSAFGVRPSLNGALLARFFVLEELVGAGKPTGTRGKKRKSNEVEGETAVDGASNSYCK